MPSSPLPFVLAGLCVVAGPVRAADDEPPIQPLPADTARWEGAIGLNLSRGAAYQGGDQTRSKLRPGFFLRHGRFTITNSSGYVTRRSDDVLRGLGLDLSRSENLRLNLALRYDQGRSEQSSPALNGLGDIRPTVRARASAQYRLDDNWRLSASWSVDALGRGGGHFGDVGFSREQRWSPDTVTTWGANLSLAGDRYMQTYYGISAEQAARTGYALYTPAAGLRDAAVFANLRTDITSRWIGLAGISASRLLGPAADSPLTKKLNGWGVSAGLAWRF